MSECCSVVALQSRPMLLRCGRFGYLLLLLLLLLLLRKHVMIGLHKLPLTRHTLLALRTRVIHRGAHARRLHVKIVASWRRREGCPRHRTRAPSMVDLRIDVVGDSLFALVPPPHLLGVCVLVNCVQCF
jgi:hypothetical protein